MGTEGMPECGHSPLVEMVTEQGRNYLANRALSPAAQTLEGTPAHNPQRLRSQHHREGEGETLRLLVLSFGAVLGPTLGASWVMPLVHSPYVPHRRNPVGLRQWAPTTISWHTAKAGSGGIPGVEYDATGPVDEPAPVLNRRARYLKVRRAGWYEAPGRPKE